MWAQQDRFADMARFREATAAFGYDAIEVSHWTDEAGLGALLAAGSPAVSSLHAPAPHRWVDGRHNSDLNLASTDESQRQLALADHRRTIDRAAEHGLPYVVIHLGGVGDRRNDLEDNLRTLYESGIRDGPAWQAARQALRLWRSEARQPYYEAAQRSLEALIGHAGPLGVTLGLESRLNFNEFPHPGEALELLAPYDGSQAGFWYDTGHCEVQARLGMIDRSAWFPALTPRLLGCHLHDVEGLNDHRAPGNGTLDWSYVAAALNPDVLRVLEINQQEPDQLVGGALGFLRARGVLG
jgi:sugar phosphate isomerase/epimerase